MKKINILTLTLLFLLGFASCQKAEINQNDDQKTHTVTFIAGAPETKTTATIEGNTVNFAWTKADEDRFNLYENSTLADITSGTLTDGVMAIEAVFDGGVTAGENTYVAVFNSANKLQILKNEAYAEDSDILVSKAISSFDENKSVQLQFKREVAIAKMTLKGLDASEVVNHITVSSTADIAGSYGVEGWSSTKTSLDIYSELARGVQDGYSIVANASGEAVVWFTCIPQDAATLTVKIEAADGDTYTKKFSNSINLTRGDVKGFSVAMEKDAKVTPSYTIEFNSTVTSPKLIETSTKATTFVTSGSEYLTAQPASEITFAYYGGKDSGLPLRIGKSGDAGSITLALSGAGQVPATKIILSAKQYSSGKTKVIGVNGSDKQQPGNDYTDLSYDLDGTTISSITLDTDGYIYVKSITVEYGGTIKTALATPTNLAVSAEKLVSWDAVDGAASYVLTIGTNEYPCTNNSYDAKDIADEYYDVAVIAVPDDTEHYKNSAAATLTDAKFGTPTLPIPTISDGVLEETSVAFSWTKDARATNGYHWALYKGETLVQEATETSKTSTEVTGLTFGTTYTAKVYALAVDGEKPYVQSATATLDLATKAKTTISTIVTAGTGTTTYAIADLTVMAVSGKYFVVKDDTGIMTAYKSTNATANVGDIASLQGTYGTSNGLNLFTYTSYSKGEGSGVVDHGTPYTLNADNIADYTSNSSLKYVKATVSVGSNGSSLTIGSTPVYLRPSSGVSVSEYAGKTITLMGYAFGYDTNYNNVVILGTSVELDQTVPYLAVDPTSKTWASNETDAAVFTVTTNAEGVNGWSVTHDPIDWATVAVDEAKGTITVTPKEANTAKTANEAKLTVKHAAGTLSETITLTQKGTGAALELKTWTYALSGYTDPELNEENPATVNGATWSITMGTKVSSPSTNGAPTKYSDIFGWKWGDSSSKYWKSYTLSTDYFASKKVKSVTVNVLNNGKKSATMIVKQDETTIGTATQEFGATWTDLTANTTQGKGGTLTINYSVAQASLIHSITVEYYD